MVNTWKYLLRDLINNMKVKLGWRWDTLLQVAHLMWMALVLLDSI